MTMSQLSALIMLVVCGLWSGVILTFAVERTNLWNRMPIEQYATDFRRSLLRVDPMQPTMAAVSVVASGIFAWQSSGSARTLALMGIALLLLVVFASVVIAEPINSKYRRLSEGQVPEDAERHRTIWRRFHATRTVAAVVALTCLAAAATVG